MLRFHPVVLVLVLVIVIVIEDIEKTTTCQHNRSIEKSERLFNGTWVMLFVDYDYDYEHEHDYEHDRRHELLDFSTT